MKNKIFLSIILLKIWSKIIKELIIVNSSYIKFFIFENGNFYLNKFGILNTHIWIERITYKNITLIKYLIMF